ncbi:Oidioi.mRNA.OKI2018_I69.chr2.g7668.t1.cds [Oikopleura dioica]|uniref:Oidioi.mRNA.OKI2018_I69.chr2.g7668.t1.cds n=1 Tax=Oikopleura dioica TaxID=34765 RepID=A0ABN7TDC9_OIKDI|nr:Oidioi.mRNA.OKI2018_I69.chr2.g7668.t1.cds [Oikopleura dioica]
MKANFAKVLLLLLGPILAEDASFASGDYELFPDLEFSGDDYEILTYETNHGILQETTQLGKESLESFTPVEFSHKSTQERDCGGLGIVFNDEGDKFWVNEGIEQLRTLLKAIERYKSLHLTIVRVSWNKPDGKRIFDGLIRTAPQLFDHVIGKIDLNIAIGSPFGYSSELFDSLKESNNLYDSPIIISKTHSPFRKKTEVAIEKYTRELVPLKCKNFHECDVGLEQLHIIISGKEVETLVGFIERDMKDSTGVIGIISFETSPSLNLPGSIPVFVSITSNDVVQIPSVNVDKEFFNDRDGFIAAISDLVRKDPGTLFQEEKTTTPTVIEDRKIIQWSLWTQNFSRGDKTNCFTHQNDLFFRQNIRNARDGTETPLETALHPIKMGEFGLENIHIYFKMKPYFYL